MRLYARLPSYFLQYIDTPLFSTLRVILHMTHYITSRKNSGRDVKLANCIPYAVKGKGLFFDVDKMGVDLATYRARIGTFVSRRNVSCGDEKHRPINVTRRWRGKDVCKDIEYCYQDNLKYVIVRMSFRLENTLQLDVHIYANVEFGSKRRSTSSEVSVQSRMQARPTSLTGPQWSGLRD